jgi:hypothetical protein
LPSRGGLLDGVGAQHLVVLVLWYYAFWRGVLVVAQKMADSKKFPPLKPLHPDSSLNAGKLSKIERISTEELIMSLRTGDHCLKTRPDGTILEGHHRVYVLRQRGVDVDKLPREEIEKDQE